MSTGGEYNGGYIYDPTGARAFRESLSHGGTLSMAAPHLAGVMALLRKKSESSKRRFDVEVVTGRCGPKRSRR